MAPGARLAEEAYGDLLRVARRFSSSRDEACDLVQETLMIALARGFEDWPSQVRRGWLYGVIRKRAAFVIRGQRRRRRREGLPDAVERSAHAWAWQPGFLASLPPSVRAVAALASADLCAAEIRWLLGVSDTALRKRLSALRGAVRDAVQAEAELPTRHAAEPTSSFGAHRALLLASLRQQRAPAPALATHDPDGHTLLLRVRAHKRPPLGNP